MFNLKIVEARPLKVILLLSAAAGLVFGFQNCGRMHAQVSQYSQGSGGGTSLSGSITAGAACSFDNKAIASGLIVDAYQSSSVPFGQQCVKESRVCSDGLLSGSFNYSSCAVGAPAACLFNGQTVANGASVTAYLASTVPFGQTCASETRNCSNGQLSGSFAFATCSVGAPAACMFNGQTIAHGASVAAYAVSTVPFGQSCSAQAQTRVCDNGSLSGSYTYGSCTVGQPSSCLFNGQTIPHNGSVMAYSEASVPFGGNCSSVAESRVCSNGSLSGSYAYASCAPRSHVTCDFVANPGVFARRVSDDAQYLNLMTKDPAACTQFCESHNVKYCTMFFVAGNGYCMGWISGYEVTNEGFAPYGGTCQ